MSTQKILPNAGLSRAASHIAATHRPNLLRRSPQPSECEHHSMSRRRGRMLGFDRAPKHALWNKNTMPRRRLMRSTTRLERAAITLHRFLHANLGGTDDWPIRFTGTEEHTPELCRLLNELQNEMERAGHRPGRFKFIAAYRKRQSTVGPHPENLCGNQQGCYIKT